MMDVRSFSETCELRVCNPVLVYCVVLLALRFLSCLRFPFMPYIQLHEYEAYHFLTLHSLVSSMISIRKIFQSPRLFPINMLRLN